MTEKLFAIWPDDVSGGSVMEGDHGAGGAAGLVPAQAIGDATKFLRGDATWQTVAAAGGIEYTEGDVDATITGPAIMWEDTGDTLRAVSAAKPLPVNIVAGAAGSPSKTDDAAFTIATDAVSPMGALADETATDSVDEGDVGLVRMTLDRKLLTRVAGATDANRLDIDASGRAKVLLDSSTAGVTVEVIGDVAHDAVGTGVNPALTGGYASAAAPTDVSADGDAVRAWHLRNGAAACVLTAAGALIGGDATNGLDVDVTRVTGTVTVDSELPAAAALADNTANPTVPGVGAFLMAFDGTNWDRVQTGAASGGALKVDGSAVTQPVSIAATVTVADNQVVTDNAAFTDGTTKLFMGGLIFDDTAGTALTENDAAAARIDSKRATVVRLEGATRADYVGGDAANGLDVDVTRVSGTVTVGGVAAHDAAVSGNPVRVGGRARTSDITAVANDDTADLITDTLGKQVVLLGAVPEQQVNGKATYTTTTAADLIAAAGAGVKIAVMGVLVTNASASVATKVEIRDGTTVKIQGLAGIGGGFSMNGASPLFYTTANTAVTGRCVTTGADVDIFVWGYKCV